MGQLDCGAAFALMKSSGKIQWFFSVWSHTIRIRTILSFTKPTSEEKAKAIDSAWVLSV